MNHKKIRAFLADYIQTQDFKDDDHLFEQGYVSSLLAMEMVTFVESEFLIKIDNDDLNLENFKSVEAISNLVDRKLKDK
jgi:methoxymalonate biosynthesis acyl carrier protein